MDRLNDWGYEKESETVCLKEFLEVVIIKRASMLLKEFIDTAETLDMSVGELIFTCNRSVIDALIEEFIEIHESEHARRKANGYSK
jgi:hypothetical protein